MSDEVNTEEELLKEKEAELTKLLLLGMPSKTEMRAGHSAGKLANWEKGHALLIKPWRECRGRIGLSTEIESIRPE